MKITSAEVWEQGEDTPKFIAKHGAKRQAQIAHAMMKIPSGVEYDDKTLQKALDALKDTP